MNTYERIETRTGTQNHYDNQGRLVRRTITHNGWITEQVRDWTNFGKWWNISVERVTGQ